MRFSNLDRMFWKTAIKDAKIRIARLNRVIELSKISIRTKTEVPKSVKPLLRRKLYKRNTK